MRTLLAPLTIAVTVVAAIAPIRSARADASPSKPADLVTIGAVVHPDRLTPARATLLARVTGGTRLALESRMPVAKPESFGAALPDDATFPSAIQREKLVGLAAAKTAETPLITGGKPQELSTIVPREGAAPSPSIDERAPIKQLPGSTESPFVMRRMSASSMAGALGVVPRPEWTSGGSHAKPAPIATIGTAPASRDAIARPNAFELQRRAAAAVKTAAPSKAAPVSTSGPRDPKLPPASATKAPSPASQEVQP